LQCSQLIRGCVVVKHEVGLLGIFWVFCGWMDHHHGTFTLVLNTQV
jgi:hypothetical protein